jgi:hypothetical protein
MLLDYVDDISVPEIVCQKIILFLRSRKRDSEHIIQIGKGRFLSPEDCAFKGDEALMGIRLTGIQALSAVKSLAR